MNAIPNFHQFTKVEKINKGWSGDQKYYAESCAGEKFLLRISDISEYSKKEAEFSVMQKMAQVGIKMSLPVAFGVCNGGKSVFQLLTWCEGAEAKEVLFGLSEDEQYAYGRKAAEIMKLMETIDAQPASDEWAKCYKDRVDRYISLYRNCGYTFDGDDLIISYLQDNIDCIGKRPTAVMHMDFQTDNMVISPDGELYIIDFQMCGIADTYHVLTGAGVSAMYSIPFAMGQLEGYFGKAIPEDYWAKYNHYMISEMLYAFTVGVHMEEEREDTLHMFDDEVDRIKHSDSYIPEWYRKGSFEKVQLRNVKR